MHEDAYNTGHIGKNMVGTAAYDDAGAFLGELADDFCLVAEKIVVLCKTCAFRGKGQGAFKAS